MSTEEGKWPATLIIGASDAVEYFSHALKVAGIVLPINDVQEIVIQILMVFLNNGLNDNEALAALPDFNRMVTTDFLSSSEKTDVFKEEVFCLALKLAARIKELMPQGIEDIPYGFDRFLGGDIVLTHMPY
jgi:hypothetical protein